RFMQQFEGQRLWQHPPFSLKPEASALLPDELLLLPYPSRIQNALGDDVADLPFGPDDDGGTAIEGEGSRSGRNVAPLRHFRHEIKADLSVRPYAPCCADRLDARQLHCVSLQSRVIPPGHPELIQVLTARQEATKRHRLAAEFIHVRRAGGITVELEAGEVQ